MKAIVDRTKFNPNAVMPYDLRANDFESAMQDVYDFFSDVNAFLSNKGLQRLDDMLRRATMSGIISDMITASLAKHSRSLVVNAFHNGHPDLVVRGKYENNSVKSGSEGVEVKATRKAGGAVDTQISACAYLCIASITTQSRLLVVGPWSSPRFISGLFQSAIFERISAAS